MSSGCVRLLRQRSSSFRVKIKQRDSRWNRAAFYVVACFGGYGIVSDRIARIGRVYGL